MKLTAAPALLVASAVMSAGTVTMQRGICTVTWCRRCDVARVSVAEQVAGRPAEVEPE
jgi:hypothetical protein